MRRLFVTICCLLISLIAVPRAFAAAPERRVALVIGNSAYEHTTVLRNPANDAGDIADSLRKLGFEVVDGTNLTVEATDQLRSEFQKRLVGADVALLFFAGHGLQHGNRNYMLPIDARLANEFAIRRETTSINELIDDMQSTAKLSIVFLDACRNNPLADKLARLGRGDPNGTRGLARIEAKGDANSLIVFATAPGSVAEDGIGRNSPFTEALLRHIETPADIEVMLKRVDRDVNAATKGRQQPERLSKLKSDFQFVANAAGPSPVIVRPPVSISRAEIEHWDSIRDSNEPEMLRDYLDQYPGGRFANIARKRMRELADNKKSATGSARVAKADPEIECNEVKSVGTKDAHMRFLDKYPTHPCADQIRRIIRMEADDMMWGRSTKSGSVADFKKYLEAFPDGVYAATAKDRIASLEAIEKGKYAPSTVTRTVPVPSAPYVPPTYVPPPPASSSDAVISRQSGRYVEGEGYRTYAGSSYGQCEQLCLEDGSCRMIEFHKPDAKCNLYSHTRIDGSSKDADVGIKRSGSTAQSAPQRASLPTIRRHANSFVEGEGYDTTRTGSYSECEQRCAADNSCVMLEFYKPDRKCNLYANRRSIGSASTADVGVKQ
jgi:hypothetical protein